MTTQPGPGARGEPHHDSEHASDRRFQLVLSLSVIVGLAACGPDLRRRPAPPPEPSDLPAVLAPETSAERAEPSCEEPSRGPIHLDLSTAGLRINCRLLSHNPTLSEVQGIIGTTPAVHDAFNIIHTYHDLGITVFEQPNTRRVIEINVYYEPMGYEFMPTRLYQGSLIIGGVEMGPRTPVERLRPWLETLGVEHDYELFAQVNSSIGLYLAATDEIITQVSIDFPH